MPVVVLPITIEQFHQLPHNPAYKYEYFGGKAHLSPRPKTFHAAVKLAKVKPAELPRDLKTRKLKSTDWQRLPRLFAAAFHREQPYAGLDDATGRRAARESLRNTRLGRDGPLIKAACLVAVDAKDDRPVGALLTTLIPAGKVSDWDSYLWRKPPPANAVAERRGRAHLTWIFVSPLQAGSGIGSALLAAAAKVLAELGFTQLFSTFLLGNETSLLWHWRNGFRLLPYPGSRRLMRRRLGKLWKQAQAPPPSA